MTCSPTTLRSVMPRCRRTFHPRTEALEGRVLLTAGDRIRLLEPAAT